MSDTIQQIVIELALKGVSATLSAVQSNMKVVDGSRSLRRRAVSSVVAESRRSAYTPASILTSIPGFDWESQMDVLGSNHDASRVVRPALEEGRHEEDRLTSSATETSPAIMMARSPSGESSIATAPVGITFNSAGMLHHSSRQLGMARYRPRQEVGTHSGSAVRRIPYPSQQTTNGIQYLDDTDEDRTLRPQIGAMIQPDLDERITGQGHRENHLGAATDPSLSVRQTNSGARQHLVSPESMYDLINESQPPRAFSQSQDQWEQTPVSTAMNDPIPVSVQQQSASPLKISQQAISGPLAPALRGEGWGEGIRRFEPLSIQDNPETTRRYQLGSPSSDLQYESQLMPPIWHEARSQSLNSPEHTAEQTSEPFWDELNDDSPSMVEANSTQTETLPSETSNPEHTLDTPEYFPLADNRRAQVTRSLVDADHPIRLPHSVPRLDNHSPDDLSRSESVERPFLSDEIEARLESLFRVQEERFKSTIKNLAYWLK